MKNAAKICALLLAAAIVASCSGVYQTEDANVRYASVGAGTQKIRLAYRDLGSGKPVLLLHGFGASSYTWRHVEPALAAAGQHQFRLHIHAFRHASPGVEFDGSLAGQL